MVVLLLTACTRQDEARVAEDAQLSRAIAGTWCVERSNVVGVLTLQPNANYSGYWSNELRPKGWRFDGEWKIVNGALVGKVKRANYWNYTNDVVPGRETSAKISHLDDRELRFADDPETKWTRKD